MKLILPKSSKENRKKKNLIFPRGKNFDSKRNEGVNILHGNTFESGNIH